MVPRNIKTIQRDAELLRKVAAHLEEERPSAAIMLRDIATDLVADHEAWRELATALTSKEDMKDLFDDAPWWNWDYKRPADPPPRPLLAGFSS